MVRLVVAALALALLPRGPAPARAWCSPSDRGDCALRIRAGEKATDGDARAVQFLDRAHVPVGAIWMRPASGRMALAVGHDNLPAAAPQLTLAARAPQGVIAEAGLRVKGAGLVVDSTVQAASANVSAVQARRVDARAISAGNLTVAETLRADRVAARAVHAEHQVLSSRTENPARGAYLDPLGSLELFSDAKDAHVDLKSLAEEDFSVRALQATPANGLKIHGEKVLVTAAGKVGIGIDQPSHALHINGRVRASSATITTGSDRRIKEHVRDADGDAAAARIRRLRVRRYDLRRAYASAQGVDERRRVNRSGFVAQELREVIPEAVEEGDGVDVFRDADGGDGLRVDNLLTVDLEPVLFDLISTVQRLQKELVVVKRVCACTDGGV